MGGGQEGWTGASAVAGMHSAIALFFATGQLAAVGDTFARFSFACLLVLGNIFSAWAFVETKKQKQNNEPHPVLCAVVEHLL